MREELCGSRSSDFAGGVVGHGRQPGRRSRSVPIGPEIAQSVAQERAELGPTRQRRIDGIKHGHERDRTAFGNTDDLMQRVDPLGLRFRFGRRVTVSNFVFSASGFTVVAHQMEVAARWRTDVVIDSI